MIKSKIDQDLKTAMLASDKELVSILRGLKSTLQYAEVAKRGSEPLDDQAIIDLLRKESKKRTETAELYEKTGEKARAAKERYEVGVIENYLPKQMDDEEIRKLVERAISESNLEPTRQNMGKLIALVKEQCAGRAEGGVIAKIVQQRIGVG